MSKMGRIEREPSVRIGSEAHKALFCRTLLDTHDPYKPAVIDWPKLDDGRGTGLCLCRSGTLRSRPRDAPE